MSNLDPYMNVRLTIKDFLLTMKNLLIDQYSEYL